MRGLLITMVCSVT